jgi:hypothetical protein
VIVVHCFSGEPVLRQPITVPGMGHALQMTGIATKGLGIRSRTGFGDVDATVPDQRR